MATKHLETLARTPSGETLEKTRLLATRLQGSVTMRRAVAAAIKAMGLPDPVMHKPRPPKWLTDQLSQPG